MKIVDRVRGRRAGTGFGWSCPPCKINAGCPGDPFVSETDALDGLNQHVNDSHGGRIQEGSYVGEISWSEPRR